LEARRIDFLLAQISKYQGRAFHPLHAVRVMPKRDLCVNSDTDKYPAEAACAAVQNAIACPACKYPLGVGASRVRTVLPAICEKNSGTPRF